MDEPPAMDLFPDGGFVRLRSLSTGTYVHADEDAYSVSLRPLGAAPSLNAVWKAEHWPVKGGRPPFLLLQGAAYGRYLAVSHMWDSLPNVDGRRYLAIQRNYDSPNLERPFRWSPYRLGVLGYDVAFLLNGALCLCSGGWPTYARCIPNTVTVHDAVGEVMWWKVETIQQTRVPPPLPPLPPIPSIVILSDTVVASQPETELQERRIRHVRATDEGSFPFDLSEWADFSFTGRSVQKLRDQMWLHQAQFDTRDIRLCVRAGLHSRPLPLIADLPHNTDMDSIAYNSRSPGAERLVYPQYNVPEQ